MDKLKDILVYKFWILLGIALIAPLVGWKLGADKVAADISNRKSAIDKAFRSIPSGELPNQTWIEGVEKVNEKQQLQINEAWEDLARGQNELKTWPPLMADYMASLGPNNEIKYEERELYPDWYLREWMELWYILDPLRDGELNMETRQYEDLGIVSFDPSIMPIKDWGTQTPTTQQIRDAQEDLWMYRSLLEAIAQVNNEPDNISDAVVAEVVRLEFKYGLLPNSSLMNLLSGKASNATAPVAATPAPGGAVGTTPAPGGSGGFGGRRGDDDELMRGGGNRKALEFPKKSVVYNDLFREEGATPGGGGGFSRRDDDEEIYGNNAADKGSRYVEETSQYKTRAFHMELLMDHRRLPDMLAALSNSPWPVQILQVDQHDLILQGRGLGVHQTKGGQGRNVGSGGSYRSSGMRSQGVPNPYLASINIVGTMQIYKEPTMQVATGDTQPGPVPGQNPGDTTGAPAGATLNSKGSGVPLPSVRSPELDDEQLLADFKILLRGQNSNKGGRGFKRGDDDE